MSTVVEVCDEVTGSDPFTWQLSLNEDRISVRELIRCRVYQEVQDVNLRQRNKRHMLIGLARYPEKPSEEAASKGSKGDIDWNIHFEQALIAFEKGQFLLLVGDRQTESLDEIVDLMQGSQVTFLKLFPLVGG